MFLNGDIVYIHGSVRVISSCDGYYATYYDDDEILQEVNVNVIEGIPLTPEILEKNGWKKSKINDCAYFYYKDGLFLLIHRKMVSFGLTTLIIVAVYA